MSAVKGLASLICQDQKSMFPIGDCTSQKALKSLLDDNNKKNIH